MKVYHACSYSNTKVKVSTFQARDKKKIKIEHKLPAEAKELINITSLVSLERGTQYRQIIFLRIKYSTFIPDLMKHGCA